MMRLLGLFACGLVLLSAGSEAEREPVDFAREVRPLLSDRCFPCHGPDVGALQAELRLDLREHAVADRGGYAVLVPGKAAASELAARIQAGEASERMPPPDSNLQLEPGEIELLLRWIDEGAPYATHWSFTRPSRHAPPVVRGAAWARDPFDRFVLAKLEDLGLGPAPPADPATLLRRVHFDLTGLPPSVTELDAFLAAVEAGPEEAERAYVETVDRLLASTAHAERMTSDWMDVARYADTFGYQSDVDMNVWPWRDWVIDAFASNLPYDDFVTQQIAGDLLPDATRETRLATTFNRLHRQTNEGGSVEEEFRLAYVADRVETMSAAFLGLTVACARCHDHKFDPISQRDFYELSAFFDDIDESGLYSHFTSSVPTPALDLPTPDQESRLAELQAEIARAEERLAAFDGLPGHGEGPQGHFAFEPPAVVANAVSEGGDAQLVGGESEPESVEGARGRGLRFSGENAVTLPNIGVFERSDPFSLGMYLSLPAYERAVVIHRTKSWTDSGSRGYQVLVEDGRLTFALVHFWPGDAIAIRTREPVPVDRWQHLTVTYDGSSRAGGMGLFLDGVRQDVEVVRDHLTRTIRGGSIQHLTVGSRFRDKGFVGGRIDELTVFARELSATEVRALFETGSVTSADEPEREVDPALVEAARALKQLRAERDALRDGIRQIMTMERAPDLAAAQRTAHVLHRGDYTAPREAVAPATLSALPRVGAEAPEDRLDLARWLTHPSHPLTPRVHVDRLWRVAFGRGLVDTPEDFGGQGAIPLHRELLDTLARDLVDSGWDSRALLRRFVLSATYRQGARTGTDVESGLFAGAHRVRLSAEMIRDGALQAAGLLVERRGGPPAFPYQPPGLWLEKSGRQYPTGRGDDLRRRSLYTFWRRTSPPPTPSMFDVPGREVCAVSRPATSTPLQTLALWNDPQFVEVAVALAARAIDAVGAGGADEERVTWLFRTLTSRRPAPRELESLTRLLGEQREAYARDVVAARELASFDLERVAHPPTADADAETGPTLAPNEAVERAATAVVASTLLSLDATVTRR